ncbi:MAG TPA: ABC transporter permease, partial [Burkholderiaceae bacterium]|nr:ABC transporter permease [Burkholderiaceae bacterium]
MDARWRRRLRTQAATLLAVLLAATALTFAITAVLPGDAAVAILGETASQEDVAALRRELGLERPVAVRYGEWLLQAVRGGLGTSYRTRERIATMIADRLPV